jgi:hypothetical protein
LRPARLISLLAGIAALAAPAAAQARPDPRLWVTVNICDTPNAPNSMGVRGAMPGDGSRHRMYVRFAAQFYSRSRNGWRPVGGRGRSPWLYVGRARYRSLQAGWTFPFAAPPPGTVFRVRAVAVFEWRRLKRGRDGDIQVVVVRRRKRVTRAGVKNAEGGDPAGTSRGSCDVT